MKIIALLLLGLSFLLASVDINHADVKELTILKGISIKTLEKNKANLTATKCEK